MASVSQHPDFAIPKEGLLPQEELLEIKSQKKMFSIGLPKECDVNEKRVLLTPEAIEEIVEKGHKVYIEKGLGEPSNYSDLDYSDCGAIIINSTEEILSICDIILRIKPFTVSQIKKLRGNQLLINSLHDIENLKDYLTVLIEKKVTAIAPEKIKDCYNTYPVINSMSEIAGKAAVLIAAELLSNEQNGKGVLLGNIAGITPAEIVVFGAGKAAETAIRTAIGLGATIKVFDRSIKRLQRLQHHIGLRLYTSVLHKQVIEKELKSTDVVIGAMHYKEGNPPFNLTEEMVKSMKDGSVIIDLSIDQGGFVEGARKTTLNRPIYRRHGIIHYCVPNIPSRVSRTASIAMSNVFLPIIDDINQRSSINQAIKLNNGLRNGIYVFNGILTDFDLGLKTGLPARDLDLLMAAF